MAIDLGVGSAGRVGMVVGIGANAGGAVGNGIGVVAIVGEGAGFKGVRVGTGVVVGSGADDSAAVGRGVGVGVTVGEGSGLNVGVAIGAEVDAGAGLSVAVGSRSSQATPTVTAIDRIPATTIARGGGVMERTTMRPGGYQTRKSEETEYLCWNYFGRRYPGRGRTAPTFLPASLGNAPLCHRLTDNKMDILSD